MFAGTLGAYQSTSHPIHMHAHHFQVIKIVWPTYNRVTGKFIRQTPDIQCAEEHGGCRNPVWTDRSWDGGNVPGVVSDSAVQKDTVIVPVGGYVIIRFKTDNPGKIIIMF